MIIGALLTLRSRTRDHPGLRKILKLREPLLIMARRGLAYDTVLMTRTKNSTEDFPFGSERPIRLLERECAMLALLLLVVVGM